MLNSSVTEQVKHGANPKLTYPSDVVLHVCCRLPKLQTSMQLACIVILLDCSDCDTS